MPHVPARSSVRRAPAWSAAALLAVLAAPVWSAEPSTPGPEASAESPAATPQDPPSMAGEGSPGPEPTPMVAELLSVVEAERLQLVRLRREIAATPEHARKLVLQREVEAVKRATELQLVTIQLVYARREGRIETVRQLEAALARFTQPAPAAPPPAAARTSAAAR